MANTMRWRYGDTNPVLAAVASATVVEIGDLLYLQDGAATPASVMVNLGTGALNQLEFHNGFLGVAMQASSVGETRPIRVATTGVFEFDCPTATYSLGAYIGATPGAGGTLLEDQRVAEVAELGLAIGRVVRDTGSASSRVLVDITSAILRGGPQGVV